MTAATMADELPQSYAIVVKTRLEMTVRARQAASPRMEGSVVSVVLVAESSEVEDPLQLVEY